MKKSPIFGLQVPTSCPNVPSELLNPESTWANKEEFYKYDLCVLDGNFVRASILTTVFVRTLNKLALMFQENFKEYESRSSDAVKKAGPVVDAVHAEALKVKISKEL